MFNRGNGLQPVTGKTDSLGRFRLERLFPGSKYVFASENGYRFAHVLVPKDTEDVTIQLLRSEEPPAAWNPGTAPSGEEKRALARRILLRFWEVNNKNTDARSKNSIATRCVLCMARIDPELARTWSEQFGGQLDSDISLAEAEVAAEADAQTAIALINQTPGLASQEQLQDLAQRFVDSDAKKALLFVEEAAVQALRLDEPVRARARARAGTVLIRLGRADAGKKLIEEAADAVSRLSHPDRNFPPSNAQTLRAGRNFGGAFSYDSRRAQALTESISQPYYRDRLATLFAVSVATSDPAVRSRSTARHPTDRVSSTCFEQRSPFVVGLSTRTRPFSSSRE